MARSRPSHDTQFARDGGRGRGRGRTIVGFTSFHFWRRRPWCFAVCLRVMRREAYSPAITDTDASLVSIRNVSVSRRKSLTVSSVWLA